MKKNQETTDRLYGRPVPYINGQPTKRPLPVPGMATRTLIIAGLLALFCGLAIWAVVFALEAFLVLVNAVADIF